MFFQICFHVFLTEEVTENEKVVVKIGGSLAIDEAASCSGGRRVVRDTRVAVVHGGGKISTRTSNLRRSPVLSKVCGSNDTGVS